MVDADKMIDRNADDWCVAEAANGVGLFACWQELKACDERRVSLLDPLQFLEKNI